jgi:hypothetical protein
MYGTEEMKAQKKRLARQIEERYSYFTFSLWIFFHALPHNISTEVKLCKAQRKS